MVPGLQHFDDCVVDGNVRPRFGSDDSEELMHVLHGVAVALGSRPLESPGTLYVTTRRVIWLSDADRGKGYAVDFLSLSLHAVSRDPEAYPFPCIYTQIETGDEDDEESEDSYSEINGDLVLSKITEMRLVPSDAGKLDTLFDIFCQCAELNPEPRQREEENTWLFGDEGMSDAGSDTDWQLSENPANPIGYANGDHDLSRRVHELQIGSQQFEDADEGEQESHDDHHLAAN
ncbi:chloride conductance regulatory protein ICln-like [Zingiber officinale]|uniref:chloride conductance regulatory protein ICln-like n=1 Tax=Zingiber officinale TaxID=94328 RepID=UPI001C4AC18E|nr:chloride conductance regulatory protein ICln-like [Zingiber officinale]